MTELEAQNMVGEIQKRWGNWSPDDDLIGDMVTRLKPFDWDSTLAAVREMRFETDRQNSPPLKTLFGKIRAFQKNRPREKTEREKFLSEPAPVYALCRKEHRNKGERWKHFWKYFYSSSRREILERNPDIIAQQAERRRQQHEETYGGEWVMIELWHDVETGIING